MRFIGSRVKMGRAFIGMNTKIYGPTILGDDVFIDSNVVIGYPVRRKLLELRSRNDVLDLDSVLDSISDGTYIGSRSVIRSGCIIYEHVELGEGVELGHGVLIREYTVIGQGTRIGTGTIIDGRVVIGENVSIQSGVYIPPGVKIGSNVFIAPRVVFTNDRYPPSRRLAETVIEDDVVIGANATIVAGIRIGRGAVIAAGAVVTKSVEPYTVVAGVPARYVMDREEYEKRKRDYEEHYIFPYR